MKQGVQTLLKHEADRLYSCAVCCAVQVTNPRSTKEELEEILKEAKGKGVIGPNCYVNSWDKLFKLISGYYEESNPWRVDGYKKTEPDDGTFIIRNMKVGRDGDTITHFTCFVEGALWDSLDPARAAAKSYTDRLYLYLSKERG